jgi:hypothetical protein
LSHQTEIGKQMRTFIVQYQPKRIKLSRPFTTTIYAVDVDAAKAYFAHYYRSGEIVSIVEDLTVA